MVVDGYEELAAAPLHQIHCALLEYVAGGVS